MSVFFLFFSLKILHEVFFPQSTILLYSKSTKRLALLATLYTHADFDFLYVHDIKQFNFVVKSIFEFPAFFRTNHDVGVSFT